MDVANNRYNARDWNFLHLIRTIILNLITPRAGYKIDFRNFTYKAQVPWMVQDFSLSF
jgi:hypothetical protein